MKSIYTILFCLFTITFINAQSRGINYKAKLSDNSGNPLSDQSVTIQFTILEGSSASNEVYVETHSTTTDTNGIIIVNIGEGVNVSGDYQTVNWGLDTHFLKTEVNTGSGFIEIGNTEFKTVPYALYAESAGNSSGNTSPFGEVQVNVISANNTNADFLVGSTSTENENNVNLDSRMFYDKSKVAFRAGSVDDVQWDDNNRGLYSFAGGRNNTAKGVSSTAFGEYNQALGFASTTLGTSHQANGSYSLVAGQGNISSNQISSQTVIGRWNEEQTDALLIIGNGADNLTRKNILSVKTDGNIIAEDLSVNEITQPNALVTKAYVDANAGSTSTGLEVLNEGNGNGWRLIGRDPNNYGNIGLGAVDLSTTTSPNSTLGATGDYAFTAGTFTAASGSSSFAFGEQTSAIGNYSLAGGLATNAVEQYSFAFGNNAVANGIFSMAFGRLSESTGSYSMSFGEDTESNGDYSLSFGSNNTVDGSYSVAFGRGHTVNNFDAFAVGSFSEYNPDAIFMVGNGTGYNESNTALEVLETGVVRISNLSGTGTRNVSVDQYGNLVASGSGSADVLVITPFDFVKEDDNDGIDFTKKVHGTYIGAPGDYTRIYAPIQLPQDATITKVEYVYKDTDIQTNRALEFAIGYQEFDSSSNAAPVGGFLNGSILNTNNFPQVTGIATANNINFQLSSVPSTIYRSYFVRVAPLSAGWSGESDTSIIQVRIHYTH